ncbi:MAG: ABC transporter substrate-binding protein, partial [Candidatus Methanomethylophilaceae archaeon]|nr:ABC transporter substrate-binding protein [Candidatus Methanomethylophilaceae archaeon]
TSDEGIYDVESKILGFDMTFDYPASIESDIAKGKVKSIGEWGSWTAESVLAAVGEGKENRETTLVIMDYNQISSDASRMTQIQNAGVTVFVLNTDSGWEVIKENYTLLGKAIGASDRAEKICNEIDDFVSDIKKATPTVSGLKVAKICYCFGSFYIYNQSEVMDVAESLGCVNALPTTQSFATVSKEAIAAADPDIIIFDDMSMGLNWEEELEKWNADPILGNLDVFKEGKAYCLEYDPMQATGYSTVHFAEGHALVASIVSAEGLGLEVPTILTDEDWKDSIKWVESKTD